MQLLKMDVADGALGEYRVGHDTANVRSSLPLHDYSRGYRIQIRKGAVTAIFCCFAEGYAGYQVFDGQVCSGSQTLNVQNSTSPQAVAAFLGPARTSWDDGVERTDIFELPAGRQAEFTWSVQRKNLALLYFIVELA